MTDTTLNKIAIYCTFFGGIFMRINISDAITFFAEYVSIISFMIILISNWRKLWIQVYIWDSKLTRRSKRLKAEIEELKKRIKEYYD